MTAAGPVLPARRSARTRAGRADTAEPTAQGGARCGVLAAGAAKTQKASEAEEDTHWTPAGDSSALRAPGSPRPRLPGRRWPSLSHGSLATPVSWSLSAAATGCGFRSSQLTCGSFFTSPGTRGAPSSVPRQHALLTRSPPSRWRCVSRSVCVCSEGAEASWGAGQRLVHPCSPTASWSLRSPLKR